MHNDILHMVDKKQNVVLLLLDLSGAFDTINHRLLLKKLQDMYGISGTVLKWLKSYLTDRNFKVVVKKASSNSCVLEIGVPQGSILGPLLFILYTKDLEAIVTKYGFSIHLYADDTPGCIFPLMSTLILMICQLLICALEKSKNG